MIVLQFAPFAVGDHRCVYVIRNSDRVVAELAEYGDKELRRDDDAVGEAEEPSRQAA